MPSRSVLVAGPNGPNRAPSGNMTESPCLTTRHFALFLYKLFPLLYNFKNTDFVHRGKLSFFMTQFAIALPIHCPAHVGRTATREWPMTYDEEPSQTKMAAK